MKKLLFIFLLIAVVPLSTLNTAVLPDDDVLLRIDPAGLRLHPNLRPVLEMNGYVLAVARKSDLQGLSTGGVRITILLSLQDKYSYYLIRYFTPDTLAKIRTLGETVELENEILLVSVRSTDRVPDFPRDTVIRKLPLTATKHFTVPSQPPPTPKKPEPLTEIERILAEISSTAYKNNIRALQNFTTRFFSTSNCRQAAKYIYDHFHSLNLQVQYQNFSASGLQSRNVVAVQVGKSDPSNIVIIGAHYDSYNRNIYYAPGADDNASGTSAVMEAARILSKYDFDFTIQYVAFGAEEIGLVGSEAFAVRARQQNKRIIAVLNSDMIAYTDAVPEDLDIVSNPESQWLGNFFASTTTTYTNLVPVHTVNSSFQWSDHASFWHENYPAICAIEDTAVSNPYYHTELDTVDTLNINFGAQSLRAILANTIILSQLNDPNLPRTPAGLTLKIIENRSLFERRKHAVLTWSIMTGDIVGYNIYRSDISHTGYRKLNPQPVSSTQYTDLNLPFDSTNFYVVTAVAGNGAESHYSAEINDILP